MKGSRGLVHRPQLVYVYTNSLFAAQLGRHFRRQGWEVHLIPSGVEALKMISHLTHPTILIDADLPKDNPMDLQKEIPAENSQARILMVESQDRWNLEGVIEAIVGKIESQAS